MVVGRLRVKGKVRVKVRVKEGNGGRFR